MVTSPRAGLVVLGAIASGSLLDLSCSSCSPAGREITGAALLALGAGFVLLAVGSTRFSDQPSRSSAAARISSNGHRLYLNCAGEGAPS